MKVRMIKEDGQPVVEVSYTYGSRLIEQHLAELVEGDTPVTPVVPDRSPIDIRFEEDEALIAGLNDRMTDAETMIQTLADGMAYSVSVEGDTLVISSSEIPEEEE